MHVHVSVSAFVYTWAHAHSHGYGNKAHFLTHKREDERERERQRERERGRGRGRGRDRGVCVCEMLRTCNVRCQMSVRKRTLMHIRHAFGPVPSCSLVHPHIPHDLPHIGSLKLVPTPNFRIDFPRWKKKQQKHWKTKSSLAAGTGGWG